MGLDVYDDDGPSAKGTRDGTAQEAYRPGAENDKRISRGDVGLFDNVYSDSGGFDDGAFFEGHTLGKDVTEVFWEGVVFGQGAVVGWGRGEGHARAEIVGAFFATGAAAAGDAGFESDAVAGFEGRYGGPDGCDCPGGFVAEDHGGSEDEAADGAVDVVVDLGGLGGGR